MHGILNSMIYILYSFVSEPTPRKTRRPSAEFEDLDFHFASGSARPSLPCLSQSPSNSPGTRRKSSTPPLSNQKCYWVGEPEAIHSVRRRKKTIQEQQQSLIITRTNSDLQKNASQSPTGHRDSLTPTDERRFFSGTEPGMPQRMVVRDVIPSRDRTYGRRRSLSNPEPIDLGRLSIQSDKPLYSKDRRDSRRDS